VTLDLGFNSDKQYPFSHGEMAGIIMIRSSSSEVNHIIDVLSRLLDFLLRLPFPRAFLLESKFVATRDGVVMRGRDASTGEIKSLQVTAGLTTTREIREFFSY